MQLRINWCKYYCLLWCLLGLQLGYADGGEYIVGHQDIELNQSFFIWKDSTNSATLKDALAHLDEFEEVKNFSNAGVVQDDIWLRLKLKSNVEKEEVLLISNPDIRNVVFYLLDNKGKLLEKHLAGRSIPFVKQSLGSRYPAMELKLHPGQINELFIKIQNKNYPMYFPLMLTSEKDFYSNNINEVIVESIFIGVLVMTFLIVVFIYIWVQKRQFLYYAIALSLIILFYIAESGFLVEFQLSEWFLDRVKYLTSSLLMVFMTLFIRNAVDFHSKGKYFITVIWWMNLFHLFFAGLILIIDVQNSPWFIPIQLFFFLTVQLYGVLFLIGLAIEAFAGNRMALYGFIAYFFFVTTSIIKMMVINGGMHFSWTVFTVLKIGSLVEIGFFNYLIFVQIKKWYDERNKLLVEVNSYQQDLLEALVKGEEKERKRLSEELHDSIGSMLSALKLSMPSIANFRPEISEQEKRRLNKGMVLLDDTLKEVRNLSHSLQPPDLMEYGLEKELRQLVNRFENEHTKFHLRFDGWPSDIEQGMQLAFYRIVQESINNTVKHANAKNVSVQFVGEENELTLTIEDDGKGFDVKQAIHGLGIKNMRSRLSKYDATFHIESKEGEGTLIIVKAQYKSQK